jgi:hypothetical protein
VRKYLQEINPIMFSYLELKKCSKKAEKLILKKCSKDRSRCFIKEKIQMTNKHVKKYSTTYTIREI